MVGSELALAPVVTIDNVPFQTNQEKKGVSLKRLLKPLPLKLYSY